MLSLLHIDFHMVSNFFEANKGGLDVVKYLFGEKYAPVLQSIFDSGVTLEEVLIAVRNNELLKG